MLANEVINILNNQVHPEHTKIANDVADFLSKGIFGLSFGIRISPIPGEDRNNKKAQILQGIREGSPEAINTAIQFIKRGKNEFSVGFTYFLKDNENNIKLKI